MKPNINQLEMQLPAEHRSLSALGEAVTSLVAACPPLKNEAYNLQLAIHEACTNVIDHSYASAPGCIGVAVTIDEVNGRFTAVLTDTGAPYQPQLTPKAAAPTWDTDAAANHGNGYRLTAVPEPDFLQERGRGLFLMFQLLDQVNYQTDGHTNRWQLIKFFRRSDA